MTQLRELVSRFTGLQHALCQCHRFFRVAFVKVGFGNGRNQGQMGSIAVGGHIEITLQRSFAGAADTTEKVKFIRGCAQTHFVLTADAAAAQATLTRTCTAGIDGWQQIITRNHILLAVDFCIQCGCTQIGIAFQCDVDQAVKARIGKVILPTQFSGTDTVVNSVVFKRIGNGNLRLLIFRHHGTGRQSHGGGNGGQYRFECNLLHFRIL